METYKVKIDNYISYEIDPFDMEAHIIKKEQIKNINSFLNKPGIYILVNKKQSKIYIGESTDLCKRLLGHSKEKGWFEEVFAITSDKFNKSLILYFEYQFLNSDEFINTKDWKEIANLNSGHSSEIPEDDDSYEIALRENYALAIKKFIKIFDFHYTENKIQNSLTNILGENDIFSYNSTINNFKGDVYVNKKGGFTLKKGAIINSKPKDTYISKGYLEKMYEILDNKLKTKAINENESETLIDIKYATPSFLADLITGKSYSGWTAFRNKNGKTLQEVYRDKIK